MRSVKEANIAQVIEEVPRAIVGVDAVEVLVVDDGSEDRTVEEALDAGAAGLLAQYEKG